MLKLIYSLACLVYAKTNLIDSIHHFTLHFI